MNVHIRSYHKMDPPPPPPRRTDGVPCKYCDKLLASSGSRNNHIRRIHKKMPIMRKYTCNVCKKTFTERLNYLRHTRHRHPEEQDSDDVVIFKYDPDNKKEKRELSDDELLLRSDVNGYNSDSDQGSDGRDEVGYFWCD